MSCAGAGRARLRLAHWICHLIAIGGLAAPTDGGKAGAVDPDPVRRPMLRRDSDEKLFEDGMRMSDMLKLAEKLSADTSRENDAWWRNWLGRSEGRHDKQLGLYDMIIGIDHLQDIGNPKRGWPMKFSGTEAVRRLIRNNDVKVAVIGMYNRGKTYLLNKMAGRSLPDGLLNHTTGLSVMHGNRVAFVDTAGENMPVSSREEIQDRLLTGQFLQMMAISVADVIVVVVNQLTLDDQRYLQHLADKLSADRERTGRQVRVMIVHNFRELRATNDVLEMIRLDINGSCHGTGEEMPLADGRKLPYWKSKDGMFQHVVMAREGTEAGKAFNGKSLEMLDHSIKGLLPSITASRLGMSVLKSFQEHVVQWLPKFFQRLRSSDIDSKYDLKFLKTDDELGFKVALGPRFNATFKENLRVIDFVLEFGDDLYRLEHEIYTEGDQTFIVIDIPGVLPKGNPPNASVVRHKFKQRFTWIDVNDTKLLEVNVTLSGKHGPAVIVFARRDPSPVQAANRVEGNRNYGKAHVPLLLAEKYNAPDSFHDSDVVVDGNGVLTVKLDHSPEEEEEENRPEL